MSKWLSILLTFLATLLLVGFIGVIILEALVGCGSSYVDSEGVRHQYECLFLRRGSYGG